MFCLNELKRAVEARSSSTSANGSATGAPRATLLAPRAGFRYGIASGLLLRLALVTAAAATLVVGNRVAYAADPDPPIYEEPSDRIMVRTYTTKHGLPATEFDSLEMDKAGFVWAATIGGLAKFDGHTFTHYPSDPKDPAAIPRFAIDDLTPDPVSGMWATAGVMLHVDSLTDKITRTNIEASRLSVADQLIWAWLPGTVKLVDPRSKDVLMETPFGPDLLTGYAILAISDELVVLAGDEGIFTVNAAGEKTFHATEVPVHAITSADDGKVWVADDIRISLYDPITDTLTPVVDRIEAHPGESEPPITGSAFVQRRDRTLWLSTELTGIEVLEIDTGQMHLIPPSARPSGIAAKISDFLEDDQDGLWMGAFGVGLQYLPAGLPPVWQATIPTPPGGKEIIDTYLDLVVVDDDVWIASDGGGLHRYNLTTGEFAEPITALNSDLPSDSVIGIARDGDELWLGMWDGGITRYNMKTGQFRALQTVDEGGPVAGVNVFDIVPGPGDTMWASVWDVGVQVFKTDGTPVKVYGPKGDVRINGELVIKIVPEQDGASWFAGWSGVERLDNETGEIMRWDVDGGGLLGDIVFDLYFSDDGTAWAATSAGLEHLDPSTGDAEYYGSLAGVPGPSVLQVLKIPGTSAVWLATADRLAEFDLKTRRVVQTFGVEDGLPKGGFARYGRGQLPGDVTVFATNAGLAFARSARVPPHDPPVYITSMLVDEEVRPFGDGAASISVDAVRLTVSFAGIDHRQPDGLTYEYRLVGLEDEWVSSTGQAATYSRLVSGTYRFEVRARTASGDLSSVPATIEITVVPHWWQTSVARTIGALLLVLLIGMVTLGLLYRARRRHRHLERMVAERTVQLRAQTSQAQAANAAKTAFVSSVSHELRNPLQSVLGFAELISMSSTGEQQQHWAEQIHTSGSDLLSMIEELLELSSLESNATPLHVSTVDLRLLVDEIAEGIDNAPSTKQRVIPQVHLTHGTVWCDSRRLRQVLANLTLNADRHSTGAVIVVGVTEVSASDITDLDDLMIDRIARYRFSVRDEGPGMSPEEVAHAFEPFMRGKRATAPGAGLGLAISRQLVERLGGTLAVETAPNSPTEFYFELDLRVGAPTGRFDEPSGRSFIETGSSFNERGEFTAAGLTPARGFESFSAILVEPDPLARQSISDALMLLGVAVQVEPDGQHAIDAVDDPSRHANLLVMSDRLVDMSTPEAVKRIRQSSNARGLTVLISTSQSGSGHSGRDRSGADVDAYVHKPVSLVDLATALQTCTLSFARSGS